MNIQEEIITTIGLMSKEERTDLVVSLVKEELTDIESVLTLLGKGNEFSLLQERAIEDAHEKYSIVDRVNDIPIQSIREYVNNIMTEMR